MAQLTLRVQDSLRDQLNAVARRNGHSANAYAEKILMAALDPDTAGDEITRIRERLARAGILAEAIPVRGPGPTDEQFAAARAAAGQGMPLSDYVTEGRA